MTVIRQGLLQFGTTVYPVEDVSLDPQLATQARQSAGDQYPTQQTVFGGVPMVSCTMPAGTALDGIGLTCTKQTTFELSLLKIDQTTGITASGSGHVRISLAVSCSVFGVIDSFSARQGGIATASVTFYGISNDGETAPFSVGTGAALALSAQPTLHTMGPIDINGSEIAGATGFSGSFNHAGGPYPATDGDLYPTQYRWSGCNPVLQIDHSDPDAVLTLLGLDGVDISSTTKATMRARGSTGLISATEKTITVAGGYVVNNAISGGVGRTATTGMTVLPESSDGATHPWSLS